MPTPAQLIRSIFTLGAAQLVTWVASAGLAVLLPRFLGDVNLGKLAFAISFSALFGMIADLGATTYLTKEIARDPKRASSLTVNQLAMRLPLGLVAAAVPAAVATFADYDPLTRHIVYVLSGGILINAVSGIVYGALQGLQHMRVMAAATVLSKLGYAGLAAFLLIVVGSGPFELAIGTVLVAALGLGLGVVVLLRHVRLTPRIEWISWRGLFIAGLPFFVWQAALIVYGQIDTVLLSFLTRDAVVGWYAAAYRIAMIPVFVPTIIMTVVFPALSASSKDLPAFHNIARRAIHAVSLVSIPMALGIMLLSDKVIDVLHYPPTFANSIPPLILLAPHIPLAGIDVMIGTILSTRDRQRQWAMTGVAAAILNPLLNLVAIPATTAAFGNGAIGAAAITTLTEVFMMVVGLRLLPAGTLNTRTIADVFKCLAAGLIMAAVVWLLRDVPILVPIAIGALVYSGACLILGAVSLGDIKQVRIHLAPRRTAKSAPTS